MTTADASHLPLGIALLREQGTVCLHSDGRNVLLSLPHCSCSRSRSASAARVVSRSPVTRAKSLSPGPRAPRSAPSRPASATVTRAPLPPFVPRSPLPGRLPHRPRSDFLRLGANASIAIGLTALVEMSVSVAKAAARYRLRPIIIREALRGQAASSPICATATSTMYRARIRQQVHDRPSAELATVLDFKSSVRSLLVDDRFRPRSRARGRPRLAFRHIGSPTPLRACLLELRPWIARASRSVRAPDESPARKRTRQSQTAPRIVVELEHRSCLHGSSGVAHAEVRGRLFECVDPWQRGRRSRAGQRARRLCIASGLTVTDSRLSPFLFELEQAFRDLGEVGTADQRRTTSAPRDRCNNR